MNMRRLHINQKPRVPKSDSTLKLNINLQNYLSIVDRIQRFMWPIKSYITKINQDLSFIPLNLSLSQFHFSSSPNLRRVPLHVYTPKVQPKIHSLGIMNLKYRSPKYNAAESTMQAQNHQPSSYQTRFKSLTSRIESNLQKCVWKISCCFIY